MKNVIFIYLVIFSLISCKTKGENNENTSINGKINKNFKTNKMNNINYKEPIYTLEVQSAGPYKIFLDDIEIDRNFEKGAVNYSIDINQWILNSGKIELKAHLYPSKNSASQEIVTQEIVNYFELKIFVREKQEDITKNKLIKTFKITNYTNLDYELVRVWDFDIKVPYKLEGWSNSNNLSKINKDVLLGKVIAQYKTLLDIINDGKDNEYFAFYKNADEEFYTSNYYTSYEINDAKNSIKSLLKESKGKTILSENYKLVFYNYGNLVCLEDSKGNSPLKADLGNEFQYYSIMLKMNSNGVMEVIR